MSDNVIILGAGFSFNAGIPLSSEFVEKMRDYALRGTCNGKELSASDKDIFSKAYILMRKLSNYHIGANFDDRNIEDILSILSFKITGGSRTDKKSFNIMIQAISRTIELSCQIKRDGNPDELSTRENDFYKLFWKAIFRRFQNTSIIPTIITFNYDLVLERGLFQYLISTGDIQHTNRDSFFPYDGIILRYHYMNDITYKVFDVEWRSGELGTTIKNCELTQLKKPLVIEVLKLHGSLNFPMNRLGEKTEIQPPTNVVEKPFIIPPISSKSISKDSEKIWKLAIQSLQGAKNIVIVGYSLPPTDIYVQYFLKTAIGSNLDLRKITVFNPDLFKPNEARNKMRERYSDCFSQQIIKRKINFEPQSSRRITNTTTHIDYEKYMGTTEHFIDEIVFNNNELFF
jgi:hypothetical protein